MKNRSSSLACQKSIRSRCRILQKALGNPRDISQGVFDACQSQLALAKWSLPAEGITAISRNSMYKYGNFELVSEKIPVGFPHAGSIGFRYLDWLRSQVKELAKSRFRDRSKTAHADRADQRLKEALDQVDELRKHSLSVGKAYLNLLSEVKNLYEDESLNAVTRIRIMNMLHDHDRLYSQLFSEVGTIRPGNLESLQR